MRDPIFLEKTCAKVTPEHIYAFQNWDLLWGGGTLGLVQT
jgi:hypothetical protein